MPLGRRAVFFSGRDLGPVLVLSLFFLVKFLSGHTAIGTRSTPFLGIAVFVGLCYMFVRFVKYNLPAKTDLIWFRNVKGVILNNARQPLRIGKYNAGQKVLFWLIMLFIVTLLVSGLIMWRAYFAEFFSIPVLRLAILIHSMAGIGLILLILGHIYLAIWVRGAITGMVTGYVSKAWIRHHHDRWHEELQATEKDVKEGKA